MNLIRYAAMKNFALFLFFLFSVSAKSATFVADSLPGVLLRHGTPVILRLQYPLNAEQLQEGQQIPVEVAQEVVSVRNEYVGSAIGSGQPGYAGVETVQKRGIFGQAAVIVLRPVSVTTQDGTLIALDGESFMVRGRHRKGMAWGIGIGAPLAAVVAGAPYLLPVALVGIAIKGRNTRVGLTTHLHGTVRSDVRILHSK